MNEHLLHKTVGNDAPRPPPQAARLIERFALQPHPEGGYFREVYRAELSLPHPGIPERPPRRAGTLIYYLLLEPQFSALHRVRWSDEIWHLYDGGPLELHTIDAEGRHTLTVLTRDCERGEPTAVVPAGRWQAARPAAGAGFVFGGCTVAPGFDFADFEMPGREELAARYPQHRALIGALTRR